MSRLAAIVDQSVPVSERKAITTRAALQLPPHPTESAVGDPRQLVRIIRDIHSTLAEATDQARSQRSNESITFENVTCGVSGAKVSLRHGLGRKVFFRVVGWANVQGSTNTTAAPVLVCDRNDAANSATDSDTLALRSYVSGVADIEVY